MRWNCVRLHLATLFAGPCKALAKAAPDCPIAADILSFQCCKVRDVWCKCDNAGCSMTMSCPGYCGLNARPDQLDGPKRGGHGGRGPWRRASQTSATGDLWIRKEEATDDPAIIPPSSCSTSSSAWYDFVPYPSRYNTSLPF